MIPELLKQTGNAGVNFQKIGEFIDEERQLLILCEPSNLTECLFPVGVGKAIWCERAWLFKVVDGL
jgi:hypothetical protein